MKIERKYMAHYLNAAFGSGDASYTRLGSDLEEYSPELTANVEKKSNIVGETTVTINGYQKQGEVSPYYAEPGDPLFERLQAIIDGDLVLDDLKKGCSWKTVCLMILNGMAAGAAMASKWTGVYPCPLRCHGRSSCHAI